MCLLLEALEGSAKCLPGFFEGDSDMSKWTSIVIPTDLAQHLLAQSKIGYVLALGETDREIAMDALKEALGSIDA